MDSLINHYTANKKVRNDDAYSPGGRIGLRPDRATLAYCQRAREAFPGVPVIAGGVEASLRRLAHYDYWSDTVRRSILLDCKADLLVYGMGERNIVEIARRLAAGETVKDLRDMRGVAYVAGGQRNRRLCGSGLLPVGGEGVGREGDLPSSELRGSQSRQAGLRRGHAPDPHQHQSVQRQDAGAVSRPPGRGRQPARLPLSQDEMDAHLRSAVHAPAASVLHASRSPPSR